MCLMYYLKIILGENKLDDLYEFQKTWTSERRLLSPLKRDMTNA
jgi:hypothetical protein